MNKTYKYTIVTLILAVAFSFGSMAAVKLMIRAREGQILSESGIIEAAPVREREEQGEVSVEDIENAVSRWRGNMVSAHNPMEGQISMEEAIRAGREWLGEMDLEREYEDGREMDEDGQLYSVYAILGVMASEEFTEDDMALYDSFWRVEFASKYMQIFLYVNAVTGKVWRADITMYSNCLEQIPYWKLKTFVELCGLQPSYKGAEKNQEGTQAVWDIDDSRLCARMQFYRDYNTAYQDSLTQPDNEIPHQKSVHLKMGLAIKEDG